MDRHKRRPKIKITPARVIAAGFAAAILIGSGLLMLPVSVRAGVTLRYIDALYTSTSAVCVTGLIAVDAADTFTAFGQTVIAVLIQIGGLGVTSVGAGIIIATGRRMNLRERNVVREALNFDSGSGVRRLVKSIFATTAVIELAGAALSYPVFARDHGALHAVGISVFHSIAAFNNAGFDILGGGTNLIPYRDSVLLNLTTCALIFFGGIGFLVIREVGEKRFRWKKFSMHTRVVLSVSAVLLAAGTVLLKISEGDALGWLDALFFSFSARTAGFSTTPLSGFSNAGLCVLNVLMFIGASPGSTGGGVKTSTVFALLRGIRSAATNTGESAFRYSLPRSAFRKAAVIVMIGLSVVMTGTFLISLAEPALPLRDVLTEVVSAFATVGLSTGITPTLGTAAKLISVAIMYMGRLGPMTIVTVWYFSLGERVSYPEGDLVIG